MSIENKVNPATIKADIRESKRAAEHYDRDELIEALTEELHTARRVLTQVAEVQVNHAALRLLASTMIRHIDQLLKEAEDM